MEQHCSTPSIAREKPIGFPANFEISPPENVSDPLKGMCVFEEKEGGT